MPALDPGRFTFYTVDDAYRAITDGTARGKLVVEIDVGQLDANTREPRRSH